MAESEAIQTVVMQVSILAAIAVVMGMIQADTKPTSGTMIKSPYNKELARERTTAININM